MNTASPSRAAPLLGPSALSAYTALTIAAIVWGGSIVGQKFTLSHFSAVEVSVLRGFGALCILIPLWWWQEGGTVRFSRSDLTLFCVLSLGVLGNHLFTLFGLRYIGAGSAGIVIGASPVITALCASLLIRDVPFRAVWPGCAVSFVGVVLVVGLDGGRMTGDAPLLGGALVILGLLSWALFTIGSRRTMDRFSPLAVNWTTLLISVMLQVPLLALDHKALTDGFVSVPQSGWLALAYLVIFATALGQQAWLYGVKGIGPSRAGIFVNLIPVSAVILSALFLGEPIEVKDVAGMGLIVVGVWMVNYQSRFDARRSTATGARPLDQTSS